MNHMTLGLLGGKSQNSGWLQYHVWEDLVVLDAAVFRVGWPVTKMETEDLSRAKVVGWIEPGTKGLTYPFMAF